MVVGGVIAAAVVGVVIDNHDFDDGAATPTAPKLPDSLATGHPATGLASHPKKLRRSDRLASSSGAKCSIPKRYTASKPSVALGCSTYL